MHFLELLRHILSNMTTNRIILEYEESKYGKPKIEYQTNETIAIHLFDKEFDMQNGCFPFNIIEHVRGNLYRIDSSFGAYDYCFRPKWYQYHKILMYYFLKMLPQIIKLLK